MMMNCFLCCERPSNAPLALRSSFNLIVISTSILEPYPGRLACGSLACWRARISG